MYSVWLLRTLMTVRKQLTRNLCLFTCKMEAHFLFYVFWCQHVPFSLCTKFHQIQVINGRIRAFLWFSRWRRRPSWKMAAHFRFCDFWIQHVSISLCINFHLNRLINGWIRPFQWISSMRRRPSWKMAAHFRFLDFWIQHVSISLCTNFHTNRVINGRYTALLWYMQLWHGIMGKKAPLWGKSPNCWGVFVVFHFWSCFYM